MELSAHVEPTSAWKQIRGDLRRAVGDTTFEIWLSGLSLRSQHGDTLIIEAPADTRRWVAKRFGRTLENCARSVLGGHARITIADGRSETGGGAASGPEPDVGLLPPFNPRYSFEQFIIGKRNRLAHAAALAVAERPGEAYNPLFLHAPPGLGKTHLLHAIGNYLATFGEGARVRYTTAEDFTNHFLGALASKSLHDFKRAYRQVDVLLIDDVQFLASKARTEEEFFHTFNVLYESGRQLVLTCDRLPGQLANIEQRLRARFEAGLVAEIEPPDFSTRVTILRKRAALDQIRVSDSTVLELIASRITNNVRALEGALIRVVAYHSLTGRPIDVSVTRTVLDAMYPRSGPTLEAIQAAAASFYGLSVDDLVSGHRSAKLAWARHVAMFLVKELTPASAVDIGRAFGGRNHATVIHACKRVAERMHEDPEAQQDVSSLSEQLKASRVDRSC